jgi:hypothetical protein
MIRRIKSHNILNGILFSISEFAFTALVISPFAVYYIAHGTYLYALIAVGIIFNCPTIVVYGLVQLRRRAIDAGISRVNEKSFRERALRENPHLFGDTLLLAATILLPLVLFIVTLIESIFNDVKQGK